MDKHFRQVKHLPADSTAWFSGDDNLTGMITVGNEGTVAAEWAIPFGTLTFTNFLFASGDFMNFVYAAKNIIYNNEASFEVLRTSNIQTPTSIEVFNRSFGAASSWEANLEAKSVLYIEKLNGGEEYLQSL
jgi:hypothetical protein